MKKLIPLLAVLTCGGIANADFVYNNFVTPADLQLNGDASLAGNDLRMTKADVSGQTATAWHTNLQDLSNGFAESIIFNGNGTSDLGQWGANSGADGIAFAFQSGSINALGNGGGDNGIGGISNMVALSFRTFWNDIQLYQTDSNGDIVGSVLSFNFDFLDNQDYALSTTYNATTFDWNIFIDSTYVTTFNMDASGILASPVYAGLGSGTGGADNNNDVKAWAVWAEPVPEPFSLAGVALIPLILKRKQKQKA
jgi:hypothetical protein